MKTLTKLLVCLLAAVSLTAAFIACSDDSNIDGTTTTANVKDPAKTTLSTTTAPDQPTNPGGDLENNDDGSLEIISGGENNAQSDQMGRLVYWYDQNWNGSTVQVTTVKAEKGVYEFAFTHTGSNGFGMQLFYNPEGTVNGDTYDVSFKIKADVDASMTINGETVVLKANEEQTITYTVTADMHPDVTDYLYGDSVVDIQFGVGQNLETTSDIVDGTYTISELVCTKK